MNAVEAGFVAGGKREGAGFIGEPAEGSRDLMAGVSGFGAEIGWKVLAVHFTIEERDFDHAEAQDTPAGGGHLVHQMAFDRRAGLIGSKAYSTRISWNSLSSSHSRTMVLRAVNPCWRELRDDFSRVSGDFGPRDLAPLARAVSDLNSDVIFVSWSECRVWSMGERMKMAVYCWKYRDWCVVTGYGTMERFIAPMVLRRRLIVL